MNDVTSTPITSPYILELFNKIERIGEEYGLYMKLLNFHNKKSVMGSGIYVVAGLSEIPEDVNPYEICKRNERNRQLFYPKDFAVKLTPDNCMIMFDKVLEYCGKAELIQNLYREYEANIPDCLRNSEVVGLENWNDGRRSGTLGSDFRYRCLKGLKEFFKNEKKKSESFREERRFWRSEKYDEDAGKLQRMKDFRLRNEPLVRLSLLQKASNNIKRIEMPEHLYQQFYDYIKTCYPEVTFAVGEKEVVDYGLIELSNKVPADHPMMKQRPITDAEFYEIIRKNFEFEGFKCVEDVIPTRWEFRDLYYKAVDEPQVIAAFNDIYLEFAQALPFQTIQKYGQTSMIDLPIDDFHQFVALAQHYNFPFHIDHRGKFAVPSLTDIHVVYNTAKKETLNKIMEAMVARAIQTSHITSSASQKQTPSLSSRINEVNQRVAEMNQNRLFPEPRKSMVPYERG